MVSSLNRLLFLVFMLAAAASASADKIITYGGRVIDCHVREVAIDRIRYCRPDSPQEPVYEVLRDSVPAILYDNGQADVFASAPSLTSSSSSPAPSLAPASEPLPGVYLFRVAEAGGKFERSCADSCMAAAEAFLKKCYSDRLHLGMATDSAAVSAWEVALASVSYYTLHGGVEAEVVYHVRRLLNGRAVQEQQIPASSHGVNWISARTTARPLISDANAKALTFVMNFINRGYLPIK